MMEKSYGAKLAFALVAVGCVALATAGVAVYPRVGFAATSPKVTADATASASAFRAALPDGVDLVIDSLAGRSGKLRARFLVGPRRPEFAGLTRLFGQAIGQTPGIYPVDSLAGRQFSFITMRPFADKVGGRIGRYLIGSWPFEGRKSLLARYENPEGFIEVTPENQDTYVSEHFRLRDFLTKDQRDVWPKYLVLNERLIDKLELVIDELERGGVRVEHLAVMSGFRTPQYNKQGVGAGGRASASRHQYGDAADVYVDNDRNGWPDDINDDGRVDARDADVLRRAAERVELAHPELIGGIGVYKATSAHGPFVHIDTRGSHARWGAG